MTDPKHPATDDDQGGDNRPTEQPLSVECPHCHESHTVGLRTSFTDRQTLWVSAEFEGPYLHARTAGELIVRTCDLLKAVGASMGEDIEQWLGSIELTEGRLRVGLISATVERAGDASAERDPDITLPPAAATVEGEVAHPADCRCYGTGRWGPDGNLPCPGPEPTP